MTRLIEGSRQKLLVEIVVDGESVVATDGHPVWVDAEGRWVDAADDQLFTLANRRLIAFGDANVPLPYRMATADEFAAEAVKFTTAIGGSSIQLRLFSPFRYQGGPR